MKKVTSLIVLLLPFFSAFGKDRKAQEFRFQYGEDTSAHRPAFAPRSERLSLTPIRLTGVDGFDFLKAELELGPLKGKIPARIIVLYRSREKGPYDRMLIDQQLDGTLVNDVPLQAFYEYLREQHWYRFADTVDVYFDPKSKARTFPYPVEFWIEMDHFKQTPELLHYASMGFLTGEILIDEQRYVVVLTDDDNNGIYNEKDGWTLRPLDSRKPYLAEDRVPVSRSVAAGGKSWSLLLADGAGMQAAVVQAASEEVPEVSAGPHMKQVLLADAAASRATAPVAFYQDYERAQEIAKIRESPMFLFFDGPACDSCRIMDRLVFSAADVVINARPFVSVRINTETGKKLARRYQIAKVPAGILLSPEGQEIGRFEGYTSVAQLVAIFRQAKPQ